MRVGFGGWGGRGGGSSHLTPVDEAGLLQTRPDPLNATGVFRMVSMISTRALMFLHDWIICNTCNKGKNTLLSISILKTKWLGPLFEYIWIPVTQGCFVPSLVEIGSVVLEEKMYNVKSLLQQQRRQQRRTTDKFWSEKLTLAFGSGELKTS